MALYTLVRFEIREDAREEAERAMHEYATYVREELEGTTFTAYRDPDVPTRYVALVRDSKVSAVRRGPNTELDRILAPLVVGPIDRMPCELVTSSDLAPRPRSGLSGRTRRRGR